MENLKKHNAALNGKSPETIVEWAVINANNPIVTTNFRPYEVALLHLVTGVKPDIPVVWCDTGYNTPNTYKHALELIERLSLNIHIYTPKQTVAYRNIVMGIPDIADPNHKLFTQQVKIEPFHRAMADFSPDFWFTNLRKGQTVFRDSIDVLSKDTSGRIKVSPFYYFSDSQLDTYLNRHDLPNEFKYYDPTKVLENRECGLHS